MFPTAVAEKWCPALYFADGQVGAWSASKVTNTWGQQSDSPESVTQHRSHWAGAGRGVTYVSPRFFIFQIKIYWRPSGDRVAVLSNFIGILDFSTHELLLVWVVSFSVQLLGALREEFSRQVLLAHNCNLCAG